MPQPRLRGAEGGVAGLPPPCPGLTHDGAIPGNSVLAGRPLAFLALGIVTRQGGDPAWGLRRRSWAAIEPDPAGGAPLFKFIVCSTGRDV